MARMYKDFLAKTDSNTMRQCCDDGTNTNTQTISDHCPKNQFGCQRKRTQKPLLSSFMISVIVVMITCSESRTTALSFTPPLLPISPSKSTQLFSTKPSRQINKMKKRQGFGHPTNTNKRPERLKEGETYSSYTNHTLQQALPSRRLRLRYDDEHTSHHISHHFHADLSHHQGHSHHTHQGHSSSNNIVNVNTNPVQKLLKQIRGPKLVSTTKEWKVLQKHAEMIQNTHLRSLMADQSRVDQMFEETAGVYFDYSRQRATLETIDLLVDLAERQNLRQRMEQMRNGERINFTEDRAVLHTALRASKNDIGKIEIEEKDGMIDPVAEVHSVLEDIKKFTNDIRSGKLTGYTGKRLRNIVSVGIGGSYLGPEFLHECMKTEPEGIHSALGYSLRFLSNVDPVDVERTCADLDPEETLIVIVSKTFTTAETMLNARTMRQWLWDFMGDDKEVVRKHVVACASITSKELVSDFGIDTENYFFRFWDWVGGRYSVCSAAGAVPISLLYGYDLFEKFLEGARSIDEHFFNADLRENIPVLMGLLGVWNMSFLGYNSRTVLPYAEALLKFPAHIQQLDMESNGKHVTKDGLTVDYPVGEVDFGEPGTNGQHSFFQLLHMGQIVPCDFIGFIKSQHDLCVDGEALTSHDELMANFFAQPDALAKGKTYEEVLAEGNSETLAPHKTFDGNRPSSSLLLPRLTVYATGQLLALYEHRTAVQGFIWDINSFDQWGVELGKKLALDIKENLFQARNNDCDIDIPENKATARILNYYLENSKDVNCDELCQTNPITQITRQTHYDKMAEMNSDIHHHNRAPPQGHDLGGNSGKLT